MTTALQIFNSEEFGNIRVIIRDGEPWFVGKDIATALGYVRTADAVREHVPDKFKGVGEMETPGGKQNVVIINEAGLYKLIMRSDLESAEKFSDWVCEEILPSIRKTGSYSIEMKQYTPATNAAIDARLLADEIQNWRPGVQRGIALSKAADVVEKAHNISLQVLKELLPPAEHKTGSLNPTQIGKKLGSIPPQTVNKMLTAKGMEYKDENGDWRLTEAGRVYGEEIPYTRNGHSGYQIRWSENILDVLKS